MDYNQNIKKWKNGENRNLIDIYLPKTTKNGSFTNNLVKISEKPVKNL